MNIKVLLIEDDLNVVQSLQLLFSSEGITCDVASKGEEGLEMARLYSTNYDLVILDLMLDDLSGFEILLKLRSAKIKIPVLILSGLSSVEDKIKGLGLGADDYLAKPFSFEVLLARVRALLRRPKQSIGEVLEAHDLSLDTTTHEVKRGSAAIQLSSKEYALLEYMLRNKNRILSKNNIISHVWDFDADILPNNVEVFITHLRTKIDRKSVV